MNRLHTMGIMAAAALCAASAGPVSAQQGDAPLYQVEVLIFRYSDLSKTTLEQPAGSTERLQTYADLTPAPAAATTPQLSADPTDSGVRWLDTGELRLKAEKQRLDQLPGYDPLLLAGWQQAVTSQQAAQSVTLSGPLLTGQATVYSQRFLYLQVELEFDDPGNPGKTQRIVASERMNEGRLRYIDHPQVGILATINRVPSPPDTNR